MPDRVAPRPVPTPEIITLKRRSKSGFVVYPKYVPKRMVDGRARYMTKCDMLIGPCACGYTHTEDEGWVRETLEYQYLRIEPLILWGEEQQRGMVVEIPGYWKQARTWRRGRCDVLVGKCACGSTHHIRERWVQDELRRHTAVILNLPEMSEDDQAQLEQDTRDERDRNAPSRRQAEDRIHRIPVPVSDAVARMNETARQLARTVDTTEFANMDLPLDLQESVDNDEGVMPGCDCAPCETARENARERALQDWASRAQAIRDNFSEADQFMWIARYGNENGEAPFFCNCGSCRSHRAANRNGERVPMDRPAFVLGDTAWRSNMNWFAEDAAEVAEDVSDDEVVW